MAVGNADVIILTLVLTSNTQGYEISAITLSVYTLVNYILKTCPLCTITIAFIQRTLVNITIVIKSLK
jgi:hypothetical protein